MLTKESQKPAKTSLKSKPTCARCKNHGKIVFRKGHSQSCEYLNCKCAQCEAIKCRNVSMARCMSNERKSTVPKISGYSEADSSCSSTTPVMCSTAIKPEFHDTFDDHQTPDTTSYERPVKRIRTSPPTTDPLTSQGYAGYMDGRNWVQYDCLRQSVDPRTAAYNINMYAGMTPFPQANPAQVSHHTLDDRKRTLLDHPYKVGGRPHPPSGSYQVHSLLRDSNTSNTLLRDTTNSSTDIAVHRQLLQQMSHPEDPTSFTIPKQ